MKKILINLLFAMATFLFLFAELLFFLFWRMWRMLPKYLEHEYRTVLMSLPQWVRGAVGQYDLKGLYHNSAYLDHSQTRTNVSLMPVQEQMFFSDHQTRKAIKDGNLNINTCLDQLQTIESGKVPVHTLSATSIGNIALIAANCENDILARRAHRVLVKIKKQTVI